MQIFEKVYKLNMNEESQLSRKNMKSKLQARNKFMTEREKQAAEQSERAISHALLYHVRKIFFLQHVARERSILGSIHIK
jgi:hypothetical protein